MLARQALGLSGQGTKSRPRKVRTLEQLAMEEYLMILQGACAGYVSLLRINTYLLDLVRYNILETLKVQLRERLFGTMSTVLRQEMINIVLSGKFPTKGYYSTYDPIVEGPITDSIDDFGTETDRATMETVRKHGKKCNSVCCTGAFIIEAMLAVLVNEDIRVLKFEKPASQIFWNRDRFLRKYVPLQIPAVLAHYEKAIRDSEEIKCPKLEKFVVKDTNIVSRSFAIRNSHFDVLTTYQDTTPYLEIPGYLSAVADPDNPIQYGGFSEHLMVMIGEVFHGLDRFEKMSEIYLDSEACNTLLKMSNNRNRCISHSLFQGIGISCPNLRVLDLSNGIAIAAESLIQLLFRNGYEILHQFVYLPAYKVNDSDAIIQIPNCPVEEIHEHDLTKYCPWCEDEWCSNGVRDGVAWTDIKTPIIDDRLFNEIVEKYGEQKAKKYLINVLAASDLLAAMDAPRCELVRPEGTRPWEDGFVSPGETPFRDGGKPWYMPEEVIYREVYWPPVINKIAKSLQYLKLNSDNFHPKHEIVPFLLAALPNVKTLGRVKVVKGLKMIRDIPALNGIKANHLEELDMTFGGQDICSIDTSWASDEISDLVEEFGEKLNLSPNLSSINPEEDNASLLDELRTNFAEDIKLVSEQCPKLRSLRLSIFGEIVFLRHDDLQIWEPVGAGLLCLRELVLQSHTWSEVAALLTLVGPRLAKLHLMLEGRGQAANDPQGANNETQVPKLEGILQRCPSIEHLTLSFGMRSVDVTTQEFDQNSSSPLPSLKTFAVHTYMTKRALEYLWSRALNLESLRIPYTLVTADNFPHEVVEFTEADITRLFRSNKMRHLRQCCTSLTFKTIESAKSFIESLPLVTEIARLSIIVGLPEDHYPSEEQMFFALAQVMQSMRKFKLFCSEKSKFGQKIKWRWAKTGDLESLANLAPLQGLVDMSDEEV